jgi:hypothetical protein
MTQFTAPRYHAGQGQRSQECSALCKSVIVDIVRAAVTVGWREQELALHLADAADDYVVYLATKPHKVWKAANSN